MKKSSLVKALGGILSAGVLMAGCSASVPSVPQAVNTAGADATAAPTAQASYQEQASAPSPAVDAAQAAAGAAATNLTDVSYTDALSVVLSQYPGAVPIKCGLDLDGGKVVWDVEVLTQDGGVYEAAVNAQSGALLYARSEDDLPQVAAGDITVGYAEAVQSAVALYPGCFLESFEVERENGVTFYDIELRDAQGQERAVFVNAQTGETSAGAFGTVIGGGQAVPYNQADYDYDYDYDDYDDYYPDNAAQTVAPVYSHDYAHHGQSHHSHD